MSLKKGAIMVKIRFGLLCAVLSGVLFLAGCGSEFGTGAAGLAGGFAASETVKGIEADLAKREARLVERYKEAVEAQAEQETLQRIEAKIRDVNDVRQGVTVLKQAAATDWGDGKAAAGIVGTIAATAFAIFERRKRGRTETGVNRFLAKADPATSEKLYDEIARKKSGA
jgi:hypothetical protein